MNLSFLKDEMTIGLNKIYLGFMKFNFYPLYYVCVNENVLRQSVEEIQNLNCVKFLSNRCQEHFKADALTHIISTHNPPHRFCGDITQGLEEGWTVTFAALQVAYFLGFKTVIIIGMDHDFKYQGGPNESRIMRGADPNHFSPDYFADGQAWDNPDLIHSEESYRIARQVFESDGRQIIDATLDGKCQIFPKAHYKTLFPVTN